MDEETIKFEIPDFSEITDGGIRMLLEKTVKSNGIWRVHKSDADCVFPSDFHAHRIDDAGTLNLYTGQVYCPRTRTLIAVLPKKVMKYIHSELSTSKEPEFTSKCMQKELFSFL